MLFALSSCTSAKKVAVFKYIDIDDDCKMTYKATFFSDNTFVVHCKGDDKTVTIIEKCDYDFFSGTYSGDPKKDGEIILTITKEPDWKRNSEYFEQILAENKKVFKRTRKSYFLKEIDSPESEKTSIQNGKITIDGDEYKRVLSFL